jgi:hypothetical protein
MALTKEKNEMVEHRLCLAIILLGALIALSGCSQSHYVLDMAPYPWDSNIKWEDIPD